MFMLLYCALLASAGPANARWLPGTPSQVPFFLSFLESQDFPPKVGSPQPYTTYTPVIPKLKTTPQILGLVADQTLNRDSLGSTTFGGRTLWTARDTQFYLANGSVQETPLFSSTASWSDLSRGPEGGPALTALPPGADPLDTTVLNLYGTNALDQTFFQYPETGEFCAPTAGSCSDDTRYPLCEHPPFPAQQHPLTDAGPDSAPLVTASDEDSITAYTWIRQFHIRKDLSTLHPNPATSLYRLSYALNSSSPLSLPTVTTVAQAFWARDELPYGNYGGLVSNGTAYLYAHANSTTALARVAAASLESRLAYEFYVNNTWTSQRPSLSTPGVGLASASAGGQGTYYYSPAWRAYVWLGGDEGVGGDVYVTTAPAPWGPWIEPRRVWTGPGGSFYLGAYSVQAHPGLAREGANEVYVTYTKNDVDGRGVSVYSTPLVRFEWE